MRAPSIYGLIRQRSLSVPLSLLFIPCFFLTLSLYNLSIQGPFYSFHNVDPSYAYLFNGFELLHFHAPGHVDHPGTTTQLLMAFVMGFKWLGMAVHAWFLQQPLPSLDHIFYTQPESFLYTASLTLITLNTILFSISSLSLFNYTKKIAVVFAFQLGLFLFFPAIETFSMFTPEPMLLTSVLFLCLALFPALIKNDISQSKYAGYMGLALSFGMATKVTFLPLIFLCFVFPKHQYKKIFTYFIIGFLLFTFPIWGRYVDMLKWLFKIAFHQGHYGTGSVGLIDNTKIRDNFAAIATQIPYLLIILMGLLSYLCVTYKKNAPILTKFLALSVGAILFSVLLNLKHPGIRYMIPVLLLCAPIFAILAYQFIQQKRIYIFSLFVVLGSGIGLTVMQYQPWHQAKLLEAKGRASFQEYVSNHQCKVVGIYNPSLQNYAMFFGNQWAWKKRTAILSQYYPESVFFDPANERFYDFHGPNHFQLDTAQVEDQFKHYPCVVFQGYHNNLPTDSAYRTRFTEKSLDGNKTFSAKFYEFKVGSISNKKIAIFNQ
jgi:hypothetical protein